ncbi:MAG: ABC transporter substrate-binding protein [Phyllobacteriaceae bacterium]|nr:ABC transporter substrate-binding protein [Phyllobacteriaceae bacterium]
MWKASISLVIGAMLWLGVANAAPAAEMPARVVSMNVCTDQLAMLIARPGQLHSVSWLAADPTISVLADDAAGFQLNHGLAEEIFLMKPDLVIAGTYSTRATVTLLRRLGFRVEEFAPAASFDDIRANIARMGDMLGNAGRADTLIARLDADLAALNANPPSDRTLALYYANNYTSGAGTLADAVVEASGLRNLGREMGYAGTVKLPLELLVAAEPDLVAGRERDFGAPARAQAHLRHPAYRAVTGAGRGVAMDSRYWLCGTPFTLEAARHLAARARANGPDE